MVVPLVEDRRERIEDVSECDFEGMFELCLELIRKESARSLSKWDN